ncbi:MAG: hypothetical protein QOJ26_1719 [Thermoplasmata archaeon]|jgi:hypothetical protein|nr:hypothetical protein [Thermoplasmata archaeon]
MRPVLTNEIVGAAPRPIVEGEGKPADLPTSLWVLVAANVVPLVGVLFLGWDLGVILLLYWAESAVILVFSLAKLAMTAGWAALFLIPFFVVHAGLFMGVHLTFLVLLFVHEPDAGWGAMARDLAIGLVAFALSHAFSFWANHRGRDEAYGNPQDVMGAFYGRVVVMHLTILFGGGLALVLGKPVWALVLLVALKTGADALAHLRERRKRAPPPASAAGTGPTAPS